ncbi:hypothetical protein FQR65_LT06478 [Abscondita terminalis]|nr:hypothetical protein FQR65_LT06478 [Abscondita terminalis]
MLTTLLVCASFCVALGIHRIEKRIVGGQPVNITDFPYHVSILHSGIDVCSGVIVASNKILTAGHCVKRRSDYEVRCGSDSPIEGGQVIKVKEAIRHPDFCGRTYDNDVAVLILQDNIIRTNRSLIISLSTNFLGGQRECWISGWGRLGENGRRPSTLHAALLSEYSREDCENLYEFRNVTENMICFGSSKHLRDACQGDSGGPLVDKHLNELVGIASWGWGCSRPNRPGVYSNVAVLYDWIQAILRK